MVMASWTLDTRTSDNKKRKTFRSRRLVCGDHTQLKIRLCPAVDNHRRLLHTVLHRVVGSFFHRLPEPRTLVASWRHATRPCEDPGPPLERSGTVGSSLVQSETDWKCALPHFHLSRCLAPNSCKTIAKFVENKTGHDTERLSRAKKTSYWHLGRGA